MENGWDHGVALGAQERIDDLQRGGLRILSDRTAFRFGTDSVLLADFAKVKKGDRVCDLGSGTGILPFLIGARVEATQFDAVEIQPRMCDLMRRSCALNDWEGRLNVHCMDLKDAPRQLGHGKYDAVVCNPPYGKQGTGLVPQDESVALARFEVACTLDDVCSSAFYLLKNGGSFFMIHQMNRLLEALDTLRAHRLTPRALRCVHPDVQKEAKHVLLHSIKNANCELRWQPPLIVYGPDGHYTEEAKQIYGGDRV